MKKNQPKENASRGRSNAASATPGAEQAGPPQKKEERKVGIVSGTPADSFDETAELKYDKKVAIYISVLAVLLAIAATGSNDAMKTAQQSGFQVNDQYAFYQSKYIRQSQLKLANDQLQLKIDETPNVESLPEAARKLIETKKAEYDKEIQQLETDGRNGKKELLAKAESCDNQRNTGARAAPLLRLFDGHAANRDRAGVRLDHHGNALSALRQRRCWSLGHFAFPERLHAFLWRPGAEARQGRGAGEGWVHISLKCIED